MSREQRLAAVYERLGRFVADGEFAGAALAAAVGDEQVAEWYGGEAAPGRAAGADTLWPLASISKSYTAAMVMATIERGDLTLATRASTLLPGFTGEGREQITLRHLLTHTSGLIYESPEMEQRLIAQTPIDALLDEAYTHPLLAPPGTVLSYSDYGYALAGRMAAVAAGRTFPDLVRELVLEPARLSDTFMPPPEPEYGRLAHVANSLAYGTPGAMYNAPYALALAHPSFGTVATVNDLLRFGQLFAPDNASIFSAATVRAMTTDQTGGRISGLAPGGAANAPGAPVPWGFGFSILGPHAPGAFGDLLPAGSFGHGGASGCTLLVDPVDRITIAVVSNNHALSGRERWVHRLTVAVNGVMAALT